MSSPIREAMLFFGSISERWRCDAVAVVAHVEMPRVRAYVTTLRRDNIVQCAAGHITKARGWKAWVGRNPKAKPGGNSKSYRLMTELASKAFAQPTPELVCREQKIILSAIMGGVLIELPCYLREPVALVSEGIAMSSSDMRELIAWAKGL